MERGGGLSSQFRLIGKRAQLIWIIGVQPLDDGLRLIEATKTLENLSLQGQERAIFRLDRERVVRDPKGG